MFQHFDEDDTVEQQLRSELTVLEAKSHLENSNLRAENIKLRYERDQARRDERAHWSAFEKKAVECENLRTQLVWAKEVVHRCWKALGIETFYRAKPLALYEHIAKLRAERSQALSRIADQLQNDLANPRS